MTIKAAEHLGLYLAVFLVTLFFAYGLASLIIKFAPAPVSTWGKAFLRRTTPQGWAIAG